MDDDMDLPVDLRRELMAALITTTVPLRFGLIAVVISDESDRGPYVPKPVAREDHHERCGCVHCVSTRASRG